VSAAQGARKPLTDFASAPSNKGTHVDAMPAQFEFNLCTPATGVQPHHEMSTDDTTTTKPFGLRAAWLHFANKNEIR